MKIYYERVVFKQNQCVFLWCSSQGRTLVPGGCWILKISIFSSVHDLDTQGQNLFFLKKKILELLKGTSMCYNSCLIDWKLYWTVWDKKKFSNFFFIFLIFINEKLARLLACPSIGEQNWSSLPSVYLQKLTVVRTSN